MPESSGQSSWVKETKSQRKGVRLTAADVQDALARPSAGRQDQWRDDLRDRLSSLAGAFALHIEVSEAPEGVLQLVASEHPRLIHRIDRLRADHEPIRHDIERRISDLSPDHPIESADVAEIRTTVNDLLRRISHHRYLGAELLYQAYDVDIEAAD